MENVVLKEEVKEESKSRKKSARSRNKRPVGRPKKVVKRPVGRPRKEVVEKKKRGRPRKEPVEAVKTTRKQKVVEKEVSTKTILKETLQKPTNKLVDEILTVFPEKYLKELEEDYFLELDMKEKFDDGRKQIASTYQDTLQEITDQTNLVKENCKKELVALSKSLPTEINRSKHIEQDQKREANAELKDQQVKFKEDIEKVKEIYQASLKAIDLELQSLKNLLETDKKEENDDYQAILEKLAQKEKNIQEKQEKTIAKMEKTYLKNIEKLDKALKKENKDYQAEVNKLNDHFHEEVIALDHKRVALDQGHQNILKNLEVKQENAQTVAEMKQLKTEIKQAMDTYKNNLNDLEKARLDLALILEDTLQQKRSDLIDNCITYQTEKERLAFIFKTDIELYENVRQQENNELALEREEAKQKHLNRLLVLQRRYEDDCSVQVLQRRKVEFEFQLDNIDHSVRMNVAEERKRKEYDLAKLENEQRLKNLAYDMEIETRKIHLNEEKRQLEDVFHSKLAYDRFNADEYGLLAKKCNILEMLLYKGQIRLKQLSRTRILAMEEEWIRGIDKQRDEILKLIAKRKQGLEQEIKENLHMINNTYFDLVEDVKMYQLKIDEEDVEGKQHLVHVLGALEQQHEIARNEYKTMYQKLLDELQDLEETSLELLEFERQTLLNSGMSSINIMEQLVQKNGEKMNEYIELNDQFIDQKRAIVDQRKENHRDTFDDAINQKQKIFSGQSVKHAIEANNYNYENLKQKLIAEHEEKISSMLNMVEIAKKQVKEGYEKAVYLQKCVKQDSKYQIYSNEVAMEQVLDAIQDSNQAVLRDNERIAEIKKRELETTLTQVEKQYERKRKDLHKNGVIDTAIEWWIVE